MNFITENLGSSLSNDLHSLYFYANRDPFHKKFMAMFNKIEERYKNIEFLAIDTDHFNNLCRRFNVVLAPTVLIIKNGVELKRINGLIIISDFKSVFADI